MKEWRPRTTIVANLCSLDFDDIKQGPAATEILKLLMPFFIKKFLIVSG
jgi:hypothetical protein